MTDPSPTEAKAIEVRLAIGLLQIARLAMPEIFFIRDSRCILARATLTQRGIDPETIYD